MNFIVCVWWCNADGGDFGLIGGFVPSGRRDISQVPIRQHAGLCRAARCEYY
jgi:hypothetical protein